MFENDTKGWFGSYSTAGRESAEKYHIVIHKDEILKNEHKKLKIRDLFTPDEEEEIHKSELEELQRLEEEDIKTKTTN